MTRPPPLRELHLGGNALDGELPRAIVTCKGAPGYVIDIASKPGGSSGAVGGGAAGSGGYRFNGFALAPRAGGGARGFELGAKHRPNEPGAAEVRWEEEVRRALHMMLPPRISRVVHSVCGVYVAVTPHRFRQRKSALFAAAELNFAHCALGGTLAAFARERAPLARVTALDLHDNKLRGAIPSALGFLPRLQHLRLDGNELGGELPLSLGLAKHRGCLVNVGGNAGFTLSADTSEVLASDAGKYQMQVRSRSHTCRECAGRPLAVARARPFAPSSAPRVRDAYVSRSSRPVCLSSEPCGWSPSRVIESFTGRGGEL